MGNKPLSHVMKDPKVLKFALDELVKIEKIKKENSLLADPKTKLFGMMLKAARLTKDKDAKEQEEIASQKVKVEERGEEEVPPSEEVVDPNVKYNPKRQDFCMMYVLYKN